MATQQNVLHILSEMAILLELQGENPFKIRAYQNAVRTLETQPEDLKELVESDRLKELKGIGSALNKQIITLVKTGKLAEYDELKATTPPGLLDILKIPGLGPKKVRSIYEQLDITTPGELEYACHENRLTDMKGFGKKTQENVLKGIELLKKRESHTLYPTAMEVARNLVNVLKKHASVVEIEIAGSLRRHREFVKDIDLVASCLENQRDAVMAYFMELPEVEAVLVTGSTKTSVQLDSGIQVDLRLILPEEFSHALLHFTGSKAHNTALRSLAKQQDLKINEYGLFKGDKQIFCESEADIFKELGLVYIEPELRENRGEIEAAQENRLPQLIQWGDLKGIFHNHTLYSDGSASIEDMARQAMKLGYQYIGISDHSQSAFYAHGLEPERVLAQQQEIVSVNDRLEGIHIFRGIEVDILADGHLDYGEDILKTFDFVIASVHSRFKMNEQEMTDRILKAVYNPHVTMLGHLTGRLLLARDAYPLNITAIIDACAKTGTAIELNAHPNRLDLDWRHCQYAKKKGVKIAINPDAHSLEGLEMVPYGIGMARKGWLAKEDVVNTMDLETVKNWLKNHKI